MKNQLLSSTAMLLAMLIASVSLVSCGEDGGPQKQPEETQTETEAVTGTEQIQPDLPDSLDYGGEIIKITTSPYNILPEFNLVEETGDVVNDALYRGYRAVSERLNVTYELVDVINKAQDHKEFVNKVCASVMAGDSAYDIVSGYSRCLPKLAAEGVLIDLLDTDYIDLDKPWWAQSLKKQTLVNDKLYFATGDIRTCIAVAQCPITTF